MPRAMRSMTASGAWNEKRDASAVSETEGEERPTSGRGVRRRLEARSSSSEARLVGRYSDFKASAEVVWVVAGEMTDLEERREGRRVLVMPGSGRQRRDKHGLLVREGGKSI